MLYGTGKAGYYKITQTGETSYDVGSATTLDAAKAIAQANDGGSAAHK